MRHTNMELYGTDDVPSIPRSILKERIELLDIKLSELLSVGIYQRDNKMINAVLKAKKFWQDINHK